MKILTYIDRINLLHKLVRQKRTGTPEELAGRLGLSQSRLFRILDELKDQGAPIAYSRTLCTYYYFLPFEMNIHVSFTLLEESELRRISGGTKDFAQNASLLFLCSEQTHLCIVDQHHGSTRTA